VLRVAEEQFVHGHVALSRRLFCLIIIFMVVQPFGKSIQI
jgi:hypothetical protein